MHFFIQVALVVAALIGAGGVLWASYRYTQDHDGQVTPHYALALAAWVPVWFFTHFVWYWLQSWMAPHHHTAIGYPWWFWLILVAGAVLVLVPKTTLLVQIIGLILVVIAFWQVKWFAPHDVSRPAYFWILFSLIIVTAVLGVILLIRFMKPVLIAAIVLAVGAVFVGGLWAFNAALSAHNDKNPHQAGPTVTDTTTIAPSVAPTTSISATPVACTTWKMTTATPSDMKWVYNGLASIQNAKTNAQAAAAIQDWLSKIKLNPSMLSAADDIFLHEKVNPTTLITSDGCASTAAVTLADKVSLGIALADVKPDQAPADGYNTGTSNGAVFANNHPGITGNRKAVKVVMKDGTTVWVMARCGNPVTKTPPPVPPKQPPTNTPTVCATPRSHGPSEKFNPKTCTWAKPPQSWDCQQNAGKNCPTNPAHQPVQSNSPSLTRQPTTVPSTAPKRNPTTPVDTKHPKPAPSDGNNGGSTPNPIVTGTPSPRDSGSHT